MQQARAALGGAFPPHARPWVMHAPPMEAIHCMSLRSLQQKPLSLKQKLVFEAKAGQNSRSFALHHATRPPPPHLPTPKPAREGVVGAGGNGTHSGPLQQARLQNPNRGRAVAVATVQVWHSPTGAGKCATIAARPTCSGRRSWISVHEAFLGGRSRLGQGRRPPPPAAPQLGWLGDQNQGQARGGCVEPPTGQSKHGAAGKNQLRHPRDHADPRPRWLPARCMRRAPCLAWEPPPPIDPPQLLSASPPHLHRQPTRSAPTHRQPPRAEHTRKRRCSRSAKMCPQDRAARVQLPSNEYRPPPPPAFLA